MKYFFKYAIIEDRIFINWNLLTNEFKIICERTEKNKSLFFRYIEYNVSELDYNRQLALISQTVDSCYFERIQNNNFDFKLEINTKELKNILKIFESIAPIKTKNWDYRFNKKAKRQKLDIDFYARKGKEDLAYGLLEYARFELRHVEVDKINQRGVKRLENKSISCPVIKKENRALNNGHEVTIIYKSGRSVKGKIKRVGDLALIEGQLYGTAAWIVSIHDIKSSVIDLAKVDYIRVVHTEKNIADLKAMFEGK